MAEAGVKAQVRIASGGWRIRPLGLWACVLLGCAPTRAVAPREAPHEAPHEARRQDPMTKHASGPFDVKLTPMPPDAGAEASAIGRMTLDKQFHGDLAATSKGQMLAVRTPVDGSAGYVAMERVTGTLHGRTGTFALQHSGTMTRGAQQLTLTVVPDSGTGQLEGLSGSMRIIITEGKHSYEFDYALPSGET